MDTGLDAEVSAQLLTFVEQTRDLVGVSDPWGQILYLNPAARKRLGVGDATDLTLADVFPAEAFTIYYDEVRPELLRTGAWTGEVPVNVAQGHAVPMHVSVSARVGPGGATNGTVVYAHELPLTTPFAAGRESAVERAAGLLPLAEFEDEVRSALTAATSGGETCALVLAAVNSGSVAAESFDPLTEATVMRALAGRVARLARSIDVVGLVGEHQLGLFLRGVRTRSEALRIARGLHEALVDAPITTPSGEVAVFVECGTALSKPGDDVNDLFQRCAATLGHEVSTGEEPIGHAGASPSDREHDTAPTMEEFRVGMSHGDVRAYAEPVVDLRSGLVVGYRGLVRWHHRRLGELDPSAFVDMIAETPLANQVDLHVARETAAVITLATRDTALGLYVPASRRLVTDVRTEQYLSEVANAFSLRMDQIRLQLDRALLRNWTPALHDALHSIREADVAVVLTDVDSASAVPDVEDFGFCELHLSRGLSTAAVTDPDARLALSEIVRLAHDRDILVGVRGVDRAQDRDALLEIGCDLATGDLYGRAEPTNTIE